MKFHLARATVWLALGLTAGCSMIGGANDNESPSPAGSNADGSKAGGTVTLVTHDSWALPKSLRAAFEAESGYRLQVLKAGDAGALTNKLVLTAGDPVGDVAYGVDNTFASRALAAGVFADAGVTAAPGSAAYALADGADQLVPIDNASVCVNIDTTWFARHRLRPPATFEDLAKPAYRELLVAPGAATSSTGLAFLLATVAHFGDSWGDYWTSLMGNDLKLTDGWSDAYYVDFTQGGESGTRPIVVSYDSSPAFTIKHGRSTTKALLDTCFRQVEYAGVLAGADNPAGARALVDWLGSADVQAALPESMYVFPVREGIALPKDWAQYAVPPVDPPGLDPAQISAHRDEWLTTWTDLTTR